MINKYLKFMIVLFIVVINGYLIFGGVTKEQFATQGETRRIYRVLTKEIIDMNGEYKQFGGQVIRGFTLEANFVNSRNYEEARIANKIKALGFNEKYIEKKDLFLFCNGDSGFLVATKPMIIINYEDKQPRCMPKK